MQGAPKHYYTFHTCNASTINSSTTENHTVTDNSDIVVIFLAVDKMNGHGLENKVYHKRLLKKTNITCCFIHGRRHLAQ